MNDSLVHPGLHLTLLPLFVLLLGAGCATTCPSVADGPNGGFDLSPDDQWIVFDHQHLGAHSLYIARTDGSGARALPTPQDELLFNPAFSPDGSRISFVSGSNTAEHTQLCTMNLDGSDLRRLTDGNATVTEAAYAPHGKKLYFVRCDRVPHSSWNVRESRYVVRGYEEWYNLYSAGADGSNETLMSPENRLRERPSALSVAPDGRTLMFSGESFVRKSFFPTNRLGFLHVHDLPVSPAIDWLAADGSKDISTFLPEGEFGQRSFFSPRYSPDGRVIYFVAPATDPDTQRTFLEVFAADVETRKARQLTRLNHLVFGIRCFHRTNDILIAAFSGVSEQQAVIDLFRVHADGSGPQKINLQVPAPPASP